MTTALDSNVLVALWSEDEAVNLSARQALDDALQKGSLTVAAPVYAELLASPSRNERMLDHFFSATSISVDWDLSERVWRLAGNAFREYSTARSSKRTEGPRRILADFVIGAHAAVNGFRLLTLDRRLYRAAFPRLTLIAF